MLWFAVAWAQQERCRPIPLFDLETRLAEVDAAYTRGDAVEGRTLAASAHAMARCVDHAAPAPLMARLASLEALGAHLDQDPERVIRWVRAAEWSEPRHTWPASVRTDHPIRMQRVDEGAGRTQVVGRGGLKVPSGGAAVLSGRLLTRAEAPVDVPLLLQICDGSGAVVWAEWQEGASFPADVASGGGELAAPSWWR